MKSDQRARQGSEAVRPKSGNSALRIPEAGLCNGTTLRKATRRVSQLYDVIMAPCGLRSTQLSILAHIARAGRRSIGEIASSLVLDRSALAHNLKPLERDGFIQIVVDADDKRSRLAVLTKAGHAKVTEAIPLWDHAQKCFESIFGVKKAESLRASLEILASADFAQRFRRIEALRQKGNESEP